eukprot:superscaffoldBa00004116_g18307
MGGIIQIPKNSGDYSQIRGPRRVTTDRPAWRESPQLMCVHGCDRSPVAAQITLSLRSQSPVVLFSVVGERLRLPSTRTCSKKKAGLSL